MLYEVITHAGTGYRARRRAAAGGTRRGHPDPETASAAGSDRAEPEPADR